MAMDLWCCLDLIDLGQSCQKALVNDALHKIHFKVNKDYALKISREMWDDCVENTDAYLDYHYFDHGVFNKNLAMAYYPLIKNN